MDSELFWSNIKEIFFFKNKDSIYLFREEKTGRKTGRETLICVVASRASSTGDLTHNPGMCPDWELNWWPFGSQAGTQSTEPHQPGQEVLWWMEWGRWGKGTISIFRVRKWSMPIHTLGNWVRIPTDMRLRSPRFPSAQDILGEWRLVRWKSISHSGILPLGFW